MFKRVRVSFAIASCYELAEDNINILAHRCLCRSRYQLLKKSDWIKSHARTRLLQPLVDRQFSIAATCLAISLCDSLSSYRLGKECLIEYRLPLADSSRARGVAAMAADRANGQHGSPFVRSCCSTIGGRGQTDV